MKTKNTTQANTLRPYYVTISETLSRSVIIWADSSEAANEKAADLCNAGEIDLTASDFANREIQCDGVASESGLNTRFFDLVWMPTNPKEFCDMLREFAGITPETNEHREEDQPVKIQSSTAQPAADVIVCIKNGLVQSAYTNAAASVNFDVIDLDTSSSPDDAELDEQGQNLEMIARIEHDPTWKAIY